MENVITLGKLIGLLFCSLPPLCFVFENTRNELARPVMGTIFLVIWHFDCTHYFELFMDKFSAKGMQEVQPNVNLQKN